MMARHIVRLIELVVGAATVLAMVWIALPGERPWTVVWGCVRRLVRSRRRTLYLSGFLALLAFNYLWLHLGADRWCTEQVVARRGADFTEVIHRGIEGDAVAHIQSAVGWGPLTWGLGFAYVTVFPCMIFTTLFVFDHQGHRLGLGLVLAGYVLNYLLELPFFVCVPVRETFVYYQESGLGPPAARLLLDDISPLIMEVYRGMSGVDNCLPSFHTSLSVTLALAAWHGGRRLGWLMSLAAVPTVLATVYLGIHWVTDFAAGLVVGVVVYGLARRIVRRWVPEGRDG